MKLLTTVLILIVAAATAGAEIPIEYWEQEVPFGAGMEAGHLWAAAKAYGLVAESTGADPLVTALVVTWGGLAWEAIELELGDAKGISVQDVVANTVGIGAGMLDLDVRFRYVAFTHDAPAHYAEQARIPFRPVNAHSHAVEILAGRYAFGYRFRGIPADLSLGRTTMAVPARDAGPSTVVPFIGYTWDAVDTAVGYDPDRQTLVGSAGVRLEFGWLGAGFDWTVERGRTTADVSVFVVFE